MNKRNGLIGAGNWIVDYTKIIDLYPTQDTLATIKSVSKSSGGAAYNVLMGMAKLGAPFPLTGIGLIGHDTDGEMIINDCNDHGIDHKHLIQITKQGTAYSDVMLSEASGRRTFFTYKGANSLLDIHHFPLEKLNAKIIHIGYPLLLDKLDEFYDSNITRAAVVLKKAKECGIITSLDLVSENSNRFKKIISPSLPFVEILFLNEIEASKLTGINIIENFNNIELLKKVIIKLFTLGVNNWVILHFADGALAGKSTGEFHYQKSVNIPDEYIKGTPGSGDAFATGVLYGIHEELDMRECLKTGACVAAASLQKHGCTEGILSLDQCMAMGERYGYKD